MGESGSRSRAHPLQLLFLAVAAGRRDSIKSSVYSALRLHQGPLSIPSPEPNTHPRGLKALPPTTTGTRPSPTPPLLFLHFLVCFFHQTQRQQSLREMESEKERRLCKKNQERLRPEPVPVPTTRGCLTVHSVSVPG